MGVLSEKMYSDSAVGGARPQTMEISLRRSGSPIHLPKQALCKVVFPG